MTKQSCPPVAPPPPAFPVPPSPADAIGLVIPHPDARADHQRHWEQMLAAGLIENRNPPPAPDVVAIREANDRLFRERARRHRREGG